MRFPKILNYLTSFGTVGNLNEKTATQELRKKGRLSKLVPKTREFNYELGQKLLEEAIMLAQMPEMPRRYMLYQIYEQILRQDLQLRSQLRTAINEVLSEKWVIVDQKGNVNEEATKLLSKKWFGKLLYYYCETEFWGHSLIEMGQLIEDPATKKLVFKDLVLIPRRHVVPDTQELLAQPADTKGIPYTEAPFNTWLLEAGDPEDLGELHVSARAAIYKGNTVGDWARSGEKWSDPMLVILTDETENDELNAKEKFAANFGSNSYYIGTKQDDEIQLLERKNEGGYKINQELCNYLDGEKAQQINGQVATSTDTAYVGSSEVQERILSGYTETRLKNMTFWINEVVMPFLVQCNEGDSAYNILKDMTFMPVRMMKPLIPDETPNDPNNKQPQGGAGGKKLQLPKQLIWAREFVSVSNAIAELYQHFDCDCEECTKPKVQSLKSKVVNKGINVDTLIEASIKRIYDQKIALGSVDADLWKYNSDELWKGVKEGIEYTAKELAYGSAEHRLYLGLKYNVNVTAAFKMHQNSLEMAAQLFGDNGKLKPFYKFKKDVLPIAGNYNKTWLETEYNTAVASARSAAQWVKFAAQGGKLMYRTQRDGRVRDEHRGLDGTVKDVSDSFWDNYYPPNGWRCRCFVRKVDSDTPLQGPDSIPEVLPAFQNNPGKTLKAFTEALPYFETSSQFYDKAVKTFNMPVGLNRAEFDRNKAFFDAYSADKDHELLMVDNETGGVVFRHLKSDPIELPALKRVGIDLALKYGDAVVIREVEENNGKQADYFMNDQRAEHKAVVAIKEDAIKRNIKDALKQGKHVILEVPEGYGYKDLQRYVKGQVNQCKSLQMLTVFYKGKITRWEREEILKGYFAP